MSRYGDFESPQKFQTAALITRLQGHLTQVIGDRDPYLASGHHRLVQQYIQIELGQWGSVSAHEFEVRGQRHRNWLLKLPAQDPASTRSPIIVGAHYDAVPGTPGADDNASGVAALLEIARYAAHHPPRHPLWCIAFDMEEYGMLGSRAFAESLQASGQAVRLMLSLEMIGYCDRTPHSQRYPAPALSQIYPHTGDFIGLIGNLPTLPDLMRLKRHIKQAGAACEYLPVPNRGRLVPETRLSDHSPFWDLGYRALMVTDTSFMRNPHYHQASDRLETLDIPFMAQVCQGLMTGLIALP